MIVGDCVGAALGTNEGALLAVGFSEGANDGVLLGRSVGPLLGDEDGIVDDVGAEEEVGCGVIVGLPVIVGKFVGL